MKEMRLTIILLFALFLVPSAIASFDITKETVAGAVVKEFNTPAVFNITIKNNGPTQNFLLDTLLDIVIQPSNPFEVSSGEEKSILLKAFFSDNLKRRYSGGFDFAYFIKGSSGEIVEDSLNIRIVSLEDVIGVIVPEEVGMKDKSVTIAIQNRESVFIEMDIKVESELFNSTQRISLSPYESKDILISIEPNKIWKEAGTYDVLVTLYSENYEMNVKDTINLNELKDVSVEEDNINLLFYKKKTITKTITGNVVQKVSTEISKTPFEKAFTSFSLEPNSVEDEDSGLVYKWEKELGLGESLEITSTTNFMLPIFLIVLIAGGSVLYASKNQKRIVIKKKAIRARSSTGDFVVKIVTTIKNNGKDAKNVKLVDRIPVLTNIHERFGVIRPDQIEKDRLIYNIGDLNNGDKKLFSYVVYSNMKVLGKRVIPRATASYNIGDEYKTSTSNEVFLIS